MRLFAPKRPVADTPLLEEAYTTIPADRIDRERGVVRGVKIIGRSSRHGYEYSDEALSEAARLYEGVEVNLEHPPAAQADRARPLSEGVGVLRNVTAVLHEGERDGCYGDLHYLKEHPFTAVLLERIEKGFPVGLSHNAKGREATRRGKRIIESVKHVNSVDLVRRGATTKTLFESEGSTMKKTVAAIVAEHKTVAGEWASLLEAADGTREVEFAEGATPQEQIEHASASVLVATLESAATYADAQAAVAKLFGLTTPAKAVDPPTADKPILESLATIQRELAAVRHDAAVSRVLEKHGLTRHGVGAERVQLLEQQADEAAMAALVKSWPPAVRGARAPFGDPVNLRDGAPAAPASRAEVRALLRSR